MQTKENQAASPQTAGNHLFAYSVEEYENAEGKKARAWTRIGVAFPHKDGTGFNIQLRCLPVDGRIVLFPAGDDAHDSEAHEDSDGPTPDRRAEAGQRASNNGRRYR